MQKILVIGSSGALGQQICTALLTQREVTLIRGVRSRDEPGSRRVDVCEETSIRASAAEVDLVVVAVPQDQPRVQRVCAALGIACIDVSHEGALLRATQRELGGSTVPLVMMCGIYPGLSGILAADLVSTFEEVSQIHVGLLQSTNALVGPLGVRDMLGKIAQPVPTRNGLAPGFGLRRRMSFGERPVPVRLMRCDEREVLLQRLRAGEVRYYTGWSDLRFTSMIAGLRRSGLLRLITRSGVRITPRHDPSVPETIWLTVEASGRRGGKPVTRSAGIQAFSDYGSTALIVAAVAKKLLSAPGPQGVLVPLDFFTAEDLQAVIDEAGQAMHGPRLAWCGRGDLNPHV